MKKLLLFIFAVSFISSVALAGPPVRPMGVRKVPDASATTTNKVTVDSSGNLAVAGDLVVDGSVSGGTVTGVDETYSSGWAGDANAPEKDDVYDYLHKIDSDDDGDIGDETVTLSGNWVNTTNPWADNEVADDITASNYLPLAGGTMVGTTTFNDGVLVQFGTGGDASIKWETGTGDDLVEILFGETNGTSILAGMVMGDASSDAAFDSGGTFETTFDNETNPFFAMVDDPATSLSYWGWSADGQPGIYVGGSATSFEIPDLALSVPVTVTEDSGAVTAMNMSVSATPADGTEQSISFGIDSNVQLKIRADADHAGGVDTKEVAVTGAFVMTPADEAVTTEADISNPTETSMLLVTGDNDGDNDTIQLQDGQRAGQILHIIAESTIDADDTITVDTTTDSTCTNCPAIAFDKVGENATLIWTGTTWVVTGLQTSL